MRLKRKAIAEYPFHGTFYTVITNKPEDGNLLGDGDLLGNEKRIVLPKFPLRERPSFLKLNVTYSRLQS